MGFQNVSLVRIGLKLCKLSLLILLPWAALHAELVSLLKQEMFSLPPSYMLAQYKIQTDGIWDVLPTSFCYPKFLHWEKRSRLHMVLRTPALKGKTNKSIAKRFKITANGLWLRRKASRQHKLSKKSPARKLRLRKVVPLAPQWRKLYQDVVMPSKRGTTKLYHHKLLRLPSGHTARVESILAGNKIGLPIIQKILSNLNTSVTS